MNDPLLAYLLTEAPRLPFVSLLHWLEQLLPADLGGPEAAPRVTLRHDPALTFHAADIRGASVTQADPVRVTVTSTFAGLTGAVSPLPAGLLDEIARDDHEELAEAPLIGLLQHRLLALLYQGLLKFDLARTGATAPARAWVLLLAGLPAEESTRLTGLSVEALLQLAPLLVMHPANAERLRLGVQALFADVLQRADVQVRSQQGGYVRIREDARARLGVGLRLGRTSTLGARCRAPSAAVSLSIGPLAPEACHALSPGGGRCGALIALVRLLVPETIETAVALHPLQGRAAVLGRGSRLKRDFWLTGEAPPQPVRFTIV